MEHKRMTLDIRSYSSEVRHHQHDYHQIVLPLSGRLSMTVQNREGGVSHRHAAVIPAGQDHGFHATEQNCFLVADIPAALAPELERLPAFTALLSPDRRITPPARKIRGCPNR